LRFIKLFFPLVILFAVNFATAKDVYRALYINSGSFRAVDTSFFPYSAFNANANFSARNEIFRIGGTDVLHITVHNTDTKKHGFRVKGLAGSFNPINAGDSAAYTLSFPTAGVYIYYDDLNFPENEYMGLAGMICVSNFQHDRQYFWNIKENQKSYNNAIASGNSVDWKKYYPNYFSINSLSYPFLQNDTLAAIKGNVGDTIHIFVANTGISMHSIHFHGFHVKVISSTDSKFMGWVKDTQLMDSMQGFILELVPDKKGLYPVHDHNLVTMTGGNHNMQGMLLLIDIK
jgi:FtsP/CotA-like multicopper oxidase with cupredoxin domain